MYRVRDGPALRWPAGQIQRIGMGGVPLRLRRGLGAAMSGATLRRRRPAMSLILDAPVGGRLRRRKVPMPRPKTVQQRPPFGGYRSLR